MQSTLNPKQNDDPHDVLVVAPDVVLVAPTDEELSRLARTMRNPSSPQPRAESDLAAGPPVPPFDTMFRPAVGDVQVPGRRRSSGGQAARAFRVALLLAGCAGAAAIAWQIYGDAAEQMIVQWAPQRVLASLLPSEKPALPAQPAPPAAGTVTADTAPPQPAPVAQAAPQGGAPAAAASAVESAQPPGSAAQDIAAVRQEIEQLRASIDELKAGQQQMSRDIAKASETKVTETKGSEVKASEQTPRSRASALPPRPVVARARKPMPVAPPQQIMTYPALPPAAAPYVPRRAEPLSQAAAPPEADPELASVPRPPMPVR
jgi:hypothetical protein